MSVRQLPDISGAENPRLVHVAGLGMQTLRCYPVEPVPAGTLLAKVFRVTGYSADCDGSLLAELEAVNSSGGATGWRTSGIGLYPDTAWVLDHPGDLDEMAVAPSP